jgi:hypothetical protein
MSAFGSVARESKQKKGRIKEAKKRKQKEESVAIFVIYN